VLLVLGAGEDCEQARTTPPSARHGHEPPANDVAGEVLLRDRDLAALPALAELVKVRDDHFTQGGVDAEASEEPVEHCLSARLVEDRERRAELRGCLCEKRRRSVVRLGQRESRSLRRREPALEVGPHRENSRDVVRPVQAEATLRAVWRE
jgi:hypothetical protein